MKNVTVSVPDSVYRSARIRAAELGTSVSALVTEYLRTLDSDPAEFHRLAALQRSVMAEVTAFRGSDRLPRDDAHSREIH